MNSYFFFYLFFLVFYIFFSKKSQIVQFSKEHHARLLSGMYFSYFICHLIHCATFNSILNILCGYIFYGATVVAASELRSALAIFHCTHTVQRLASS